MWLFQHHVTPASANQKVAILAYRLRSATPVVEVTVLLVLTFVPIRFAIARKIEQQSLPPTWSDDSHIASHRSDRYDTGTPRRMSPWLQAARSPQINLLNHPVVSSAAKLWRPCARAEAGFNNELLTQQREEREREKGGLARLQNTTTSPNISHLLIKSCNVSICLVGMWLTIHVTEG